MSRTIDYAIELDPDFANFYPAVPYPGTALYEKAVRDGLLADEDWTRMEYWSTCAGQRSGPAGRDGHINRAKRRFFLRAWYVRRRLGDVVKLAVTKPVIVKHVLRRTIFGTV